jgi:hypothetical protein
MAIVEGKTQQELKQTIIDFLMNPSVKINLHTIEYGTSKIKLESQDFAMAEENDGRFYVTIEGYDIEIKTKFYNGAAELFSELPYSLRNKLTIVRG